jgi:hypothetical protein
VVLFRRGWCSQNPAIVDPVTHAIKDDCIRRTDVSCGPKYNCFEDPECVGRTSCPTWGTVALTSVLYEPGTGRMLSSDVEVNAWDGTVTDLPSTQGQLPAHGWYFTCYPDPTSMPATHCTRYGDDGCSYIDLQNTVTHEAGHFLGLAHPCTTDPSAATAKIPLCSASVPDPEVAFTARTMAPTTSPGETSKRRLSADDVDGICAIYPAASGGCACGAASGAGALSLLALALALRPRRPRAGERPHETTRPA